MVDECMTDVWGWLYGPVICALTLTYAITLRCFMGLSGVFAV